MTASIRPDAAAAPLAREAPATRSHPQRFQPEHAGRRPAGVPAPCKAADDLVAPPRLIRPQAGAQGTTPAWFHSIQLAPKPAWLNQKELSKGLEPLPLLTMEVDRPYTGRPTTSKMAQPGHLWYLDCRADGRCSTRQTEDLDATWTQASADMRRRGSSAVSRSFVPTSVSWLTGTETLEPELGGRGRTFESCRAHGLTKPFLRARNAEKCAIRPSYSASVRT